MAARLRVRDNGLDARVDNLADAAALKRAMRE